MAFVSKKTHMRGNLTKLRNKIVTSCKVTSFNLVDNLDQLNCLATTEEKYIEAACASAMNNVTEADGTSQMRKSITKQMQMRSHAYL